MMVLLHDVGHCDCCLSYMNGYLSRIRKSNKIGLVGLLQLYKL